MQRAAQGERSAAVPAASVRIRTPPAPGREKQLPHVVLKAWDLEQGREGGRTGALSSSEIDLMGPR